MSRNWLRECTLQVNGATVRGGGLTDLRIVFKITQTTIQSPNPARFRVYNCSPGTAAALKAAEGSKVTLSGGYEGNTGVLYIGDLKQFIAGHETAVDSYVDLLCAGGDQAYNQSRVTKTLASGWTPQDKLQAALDAMGKFGVTMGLTNVDLSQPKYPRGIPLVGMARQILREVAFTAKSTFSVNNDRLDLVNPKMSVGSSTVEMSPTTGMIGWAKQTPDGIIVRSLINSALQPHTTIHLDQSAINQGEKDVNPLTSAGSQQNFGLSTAGVIAPDGLYRIISLSRSGDTRGQDWYDESVCIAQSGGSPTAGQLQQGLSLGSS